MKLRIKKFADLSISRKLLVILTGTTTAILLLASIAFIFLNLYNFRIEEVRKLTSLCRIVGQSCASAIVFDDPLSATKTLHVLSSEKPTVRACIYKANGEFFAEYSRPGVQQEPDPKVDKKGWIFYNGRYHVIEPIYFDKKVIGMMYICSDLSVLSQLMRNTIVVTGFILLMSLIMGFVLSSYLHPFISQPILDLTSLAQSICDNKSYSPRVTPSSNDELGKLMICFNQMLSQIQSRDIELEKLNTELEGRVEDRTSEVSKLNAELKKRVSELESANRELETFAYSISHDLRAPIRHIDSFAKLLNDNIRASTDLESHELLSLISTAAMKMGAMIDALLAFSRTSRAELVRRDTSIDEVVLGVKDELMHYEKGRTIEWTFGKLPTLKADPAMMRVVFTNLLSNAMKFTAKQKVASIHVSCKSDSKEHIFSIKDNGVGFDMQYYERLFGVFQRLHQTEEFEGNGIGLALIRRIIDRHGGRSWAEAAVNQGATFYFSIPIES